jgi:signal peptidase I
MKKMKINIGNIFKIIITGILMALVLTIAVGYVAGYKMFIVDGNSMEPLYMYRSVVIDHKFPAPEMKIGDAITFRAIAGAKPVTHQLVRVELENGTTVAEFRDYVDYDPSWEENGETIVMLEEYGTDVCAWYSTTEIDDAMRFITQGTDFTPNPFDGSEDSTRKTYAQIEGTVLFSINNLGHIIVFIQQNIMLVSGTFLVLILLINTVKNDLNKNSPIVKKEDEEDK